MNKDKMYSLKYSYTCTCMHSQNFVFMSMSSICLNTQWCPCRQHAVSRIIKDVENK